MRASTVTWRLSFDAEPTPETFQQLAGVLGPLTRVVPSPGHGATLSGIGLREYDLVEQERRLSPGEIALSCVAKAHRLGRGWALMWPGTRGNPRQGWPREEVERATRPEYLQGFAGIRVGAGGDGTPVPGLLRAGFFVEVADEISASVAPAPPAPRPPAELAPAATGPEALAVTRAVLNLLVGHRGRAWLWDADGARRQVLAMGGTATPESAVQESFSLPDGTALRLAVDGGRVLRVELVLVEQPDPHLLDETAFATLQGRLEALFTTAVKAASPLLGTPAFAGASGEHGFPPDLWAELAAVWPQPAGRILVAVTHDDRELPMRLSLLFAPPAAGA